MCVWLWEKIRRIEVGGMVLGMQDRARQGGHAGHETERAFRDKGSSVSDLGLFTNSINLLKI